MEEKDEAHRRSSCSVSDLLKIKTTADKLAIVSMVAVLCVPLIFFPYITREAFSIWKAVAIAVAAVCLMISWVLKCRENGEFCMVFPYYTVPLFIYLGAIVLASLFSVDRFASLFGEYGRYEGLTIILAYMALAVLPKTLLKKKDVEPLLAIWMAISLAISAYSLLQSFGIDFGIWKASFVGERAFSALGNPLYLSAYLVLTLPVAIGFYLSRRSLLAILAVALGVPSLIVTYSRSGWLAFIFVLVLFPALMLRSSGFGFPYAAQRRRALAVGAVLIGLAIAALPLIPRLGEGVESAFNTGAASIASRVHLWKLTALMVAERPVLGYGPETFLEVSSAQLDLKQQRSEKNTQYDRPHSDLLQVAFSSGLLGLSAYLYYLIRYFSRMATLPKDPDWGPIAAGLFTGAMGYLIAIQLSFSTLAVAPVMWLAMAMTGVLAENGDELTLRMPAIAAIGFVSIACLVILVPQIASLAGDAMLQRSISAESTGGYREAYESADLAARIDPWHIEYAIRRGEVLEKLGKYKEAACAFEDAMKMRPLRYEPYARLAMIAYEQKYFDKAIERALEALKRYPLHYESRLIYALSSAFQGDLRAAKENLLLLQAVDPSDYRAFYYLGRIYADRGDIGLAKAQMQRVLALDTKDPLARTAAEQIIRAR